MLTFNNKIVLSNDKWIEKPELVLPPATIRLRYASGTTPTFSKGTAVCVDEANNVWDLTYNNYNWSNLLRGHSNLIEVIGGNLQSVTHCDSLFFNCTSLKKVGKFTNTSQLQIISQLFQYDSNLEHVELFDTSNAISFNQMFYECTSLETTPAFDASNGVYMVLMYAGCTSLKKVPLLLTGKADEVTGMFVDCYNVESGALALYQQLSSQSPAISKHGSCFGNCGRDTVTGAAELAQIPQDWQTGA